MELQFLLQKYTNPGARKWRGEKIRIVRKQKTLARLPL